MPRRQRFPGRGWDDRQQDGYEQREQKAREIRTVDDVVSDVDPSRTRSAYAGPRFRWLLVICLELEVILLI